MIFERTTQIIPVIIDVHLRQARPIDAYPISQLMQRAMRELSTPHYTPEQIESLMTDDLTPDMRLIEDGTYFVMESQGKIIACGGWGKYPALHNGDITHETVDSKTDVAKIRLMFVDPDYARCGLATTLLEFSLFDARMEGYIHFELIGTLTAESLYRRFGFQTIEHIEYTDDKGVTLPLVRMEKS